MFSGGARAPSSPAQLESTTDVLTPDRYTPIWSGATSGGWHPGARSIGIAKRLIPAISVSVTTKAKPAPAACASRAGHASTCDSYSTPPDCTPMERPVPIAM